MNNKTTNLTLIGFVVLFLSVFTFFTINSWNIISKIKVNGDIYSNIVLNKDLISDILPPPLYILESYTITLEFLNAETNHEKDTLVQKITELQTNYNNTFIHWQEKNNQYDKNILNTANIHAHNFYTIVFNKIIPNIKNKEIINIFFPEAKKEYILHRNAIDKAVIGLKEAIKQNEEKSAQKMNDLIQYFLFAFIICIFFILISSYFIIKKISKYQNNLYQLNSILKNLNETLEHKVNERTQELNDTIKNLTTTQKKLIEAEKLSSLGTLIAGISHEMNTPLGNSLLTATTMDNENKKIYSLFNINKISKSLLNDFLDKNNQGMNIILTNLEKTIDLVQKFKQLSIENKTVNLENINLKLFFDKFIKSSDLIKQEYTISTYIPNDILIYSSEQNLYNIFKNLLDNSITHGFLNKKNGQIAIEAINHPESNKINIIFSDNGKGMNDDIKNKVFEPFFTTQFGKGNNGLGMNLVYNIVTSMNGEITFDSEINKGTIWIISIPIVTKTT